MIFYAYLRNQTLKTFSIILSMWVILGSPQFLHAQCSPDGSGENTPGLYINEIYNIGPNEFVELVVVGNPTCGGNNCLDIDQWILDDNCGIFSGCMGSCSGQGITAEHIKFNNSQWSCVPFGSLIVIYKGINGLTDDPYDSDGDNVYIFPWDQDDLLDYSNNDYPASATGINSYSGATYDDLAPSGLIYPIAMANSSDGIGVFAPTDLMNPFHSIGWGSSTYVSCPNLNETTSFNNSSSNNPSDCDYSILSNSPGDSNNSANGEWIASMKPSALYLNISSIVMDASCDDDGGSIELILPSGMMNSDYNFTWTPSTYSGNPITNIPSGSYEVEICRNSTGCDTTIIVDVLMPEMATIDDLDVCENESSIITYTGTVVDENNFSVSPSSLGTITSSGGDYIFTHGGTDVSGTVTITNVDGCMADANITVNSTITPTFGFQTLYCENDTPDVLPPTSDNGIDGTWNPDIINTTLIGASDYIFTPSDPSQCGIMETVSITVNPQVIPTFSFLTVYCENDSPNALPLTSDNGIDGTWSPVMINPSTIGITTYTFTANNPIQCGTTITEDVTVIADPIPDATTFNACDFTSVDLDGMVSMVTSDPSTTVTWYEGDPDNGGVEINTNPYDVSSSNIWVLLENNGCTSATMITFNSDMCCPDNLASFTPNPVTIDNESSCTTGCSIVDGMLSDMDDCPSGSTKMYSEDNGMTWSSTLPTYDDYDAMTILSRCDCDSDPTIVSAESIIMTDPLPCQKDSVQFPGIGLGLCFHECREISIIVYGNYPQNIVVNSGGTLYPLTVNPGVNNFTLCYYEYLGDFNYDDNTTLEFFIVSAESIYGCPSEILDIGYTNVIPLRPRTEVGQTDFEVCDLTSVNLDALESDVISVGSFVTWYDGEPNNGGTSISDNIYDVSSGNIWVRISDFEWCDTTALINFTEYPKPSLTSFPNSLCEGSCATAEIENSTLETLTFDIQVGSDNYSWSVPPGTQSLEICYNGSPSSSPSWDLNSNPEGDYTAILSPITASNGCIYDFDDPTISLIESNIATFDDVTIDHCPNETFVFPTPNNGISGSWSPATYMGTGNYTFNPTEVCPEPTVITVTEIDPIIPEFSLTKNYCIDDLPEDLPNTSINGISGTWNPASISTSTTGVSSYTFTPNDPSQCSAITSVDVTVNSSITPVFSFQTIYCVNESPDVLPTTSDNGIDGDWSPTTISTATEGSTTYTFTPNDPSQCGTSTTVDITVNPGTAPSFSFQTSYCENATADPLPTTSDNGIEGTWSPAMINSGTIGITTYTFTANNPIQCGTTITEDVTVIANPIPDATTFNACDFTSVDLDGMVSMVTSDPSTTVTWYEGDPDNGGVEINTNPYDVSSGNIWVLLENNGCTSATMITFNSDMCCPDNLASFTPNPVTIDAESQCLPDCMFKIGQLSDTDDCPNGSTKMYSFGGFSWTSNLPPYHPHDPITVLSRCECDSDPSVVSMTSMITTNPESCDLGDANITNIPTDLCEGECYEFNIVVEVSTSMVVRFRIGNFSNPITYSPPLTAGTHTFTICYGGGTGDYYFNVGDYPLLKFLGFETSEGCLTNVYDSDHYVTFHDSIPPPDQTSFDVCDVSSVDLIALNDDITSDPSLTVSWYEGDPDSGGVEINTNPYDVSSGNIWAQISREDYCSISVPVSFTEYPKPSLTSFPNSLCEGSCATAEIENSTLETLTFDMQVGSDNYSWSVPPGTQSLEICYNGSPSSSPSWNLSSNPEGDYTAILSPITTSNGCIYDFDDPTISLIESNIATFDDVTIDHCPIETFVFPTPNNGISGSWNPATYMGTGNYTFNPTEVCPQPTVITVTEIDPIKPEFSLTENYCIDDLPEDLPNISVNGISGTWNPAIINTSTAITSTYTFTPDPGGCNPEFSITISVMNCNCDDPALVDITSWPTSICEGETINLTALGSGSTSNITWSSSGDGSFDDINIDTPIYTPGPGDISNESVVIEVTTNDPDGGGPCVEAIAQITVIITPLTTAIFDNTDYEYCLGETFTLPDPINGVIGMWDNPYTTPGTYTFTPDGDCIETTTITVAEVSCDCTDPPTVNISPSGTFCEDDFINLTASISGDASTVLWQSSGDGFFDDDTSLNPVYTPGTNDIATGVVQISIATDDPDGSGICTAATDQVIININSILLATFEDYEIEYCNVDFFEFPLPNNGINGTWNPSTYNGSGDYTFTPDGLCVESTTVSINEINSLVPSFSITDMYCTGETPDALPTTSINGIDGTWNVTDISTSTSGTSTYTFTPDSGQCSDDFVIDIAVEDCDCADPAMVSISTSQTEICESETIMAAATLGGSATSVTWTSNGDGTFDDDTSLNPTYTPGTNDKSTGSVLLIATSNDPDGSAPCSAASAQIAITINPTMIATFDDMVIEHCVLNNFDFPTSNNGLAGSWNPSTYDGTGDYIFTPDGDCAETTTISINESSAIIPTFSITDTYCTGDTPDALPTTSSNGISGSWNLSDIATSTSGTTTYIFTPDSGQCAENFEIGINVEDCDCADPAILTVTPTETEICENETVYLTATIGGSATSVTWTSNGDGTFDDDTSLNPTYTPGSADNSTRVVVITATTNDPDGNDPCSAVSVIMSITINPTIVATFDDVVIEHCGLNNFDFPLPNNGISGSWNPSTYNSGGDYVFTPDGDCTETTTITVIESTVIIPTFSITDTYCTGDTPDLLPATSSNGISGAWNLSDIATSTSGTTTYIFTPDSGQCAENFEIEITVDDCDCADPAIVGVSSTQTEICEGENTMVRATLGGSATSVKWTSDGDGTFDDDTSLNPTYTPGTMDIILGSVLLTATTNDPDGSDPCSAGSVQVALTINPTMVATFDDVVIEHCGLNNFDFPLPNNGLAGSWNPSTYNGTGDYVFTPDGACAETTTISINESSAIIPSFSITDTYCTGDTPDVLTATSSNGISGSWNVSDISTSTSGTTTYIFTPDSGQCSENFEIEITVDDCDCADPAIIGVSSTQSEICEGESTMVRATLGGSATSVKWTSDGDGTFDDDTSLNPTYTPGTMDIILGSVLLSATSDDPDGADPCSAAADQIVITINSSIEAVFDVLVIEHCEQNNFVFPTPTNGLSGSWNPSTYVGSGDYTFTPDGGCASTTIITVNAAMDITPTFTISDMYCTDETPDVLPLTSGNGINGAWNTPDISTSTAGTTTYIFTPESGQCAAIFELEVTVGSAITEEFDLIICESEEISIHGETISVADQGKIISVPGGSISSNCDSLLMINLSVLVNTESSYFETFCDPNKSVTIGNDVYNMAYPSGTSIIQNVVGCDSIITVALEYQDMEITLTSLPSCDNEENYPLSLQSIEGGMEPYSISFGNQSISITDAQLPYTLFMTNITGQLTVSDNQGCMADAPYEIDTASSLSLELVENDEVLTIVGDDADILAIDSVSWNNPELLSCGDCLESEIIAYSDNSLYSVDIYYSGGCILTLYALVKRKIFTYSFPNIIAPTSGSNSNFFISLNKESNDRVVSMNIYDRWGNRVYQSTDEEYLSNEGGWNGHFDNGNRNVVPGVYNFAVQIRINDKIETFIGDVTVVL